MLPESMLASRRRCVVLGLDGLPFSLAERLCDRGLMTNLARLLDSGKAKAMRAELPELSPVNWTSFATAAGPGEHCVFGFVRMDPQTYRLGLADATAVRLPTIFDRLGERGLTSRVINLPNMYPSRPFQGELGSLIAGFTAPDLEKAVHPPQLLRQLQAAGYRIEADTVRGKEDHAFLLADLSAVLGLRRIPLGLLWPGLEWDLFVLVITETDRLFHFLFPAVEDKAHPFHAGSLRLLANIDKLVGDVQAKFAALPEPKRLLVMADHGFCELETEVDLNAWLKGRGYLRTSGPANHALDLSVISPQSAAFALDPGRIYLHTKRRFARGGLADDEAVAFRQRLRHELMELRYKGSPVMEQVYAADEIYDGPCLDAAPDLVCQGRHGFDLKAKFDRIEVFGRFGRSGMHTADDVFFFDSNGEKAERVRDVGRLVLDFFDAS